MIAVLMGYSPTSKIPDPEIFVRMLLDDVMAMAPRFVEMESACRALRKTKTFMPAISEVLKELETQQKLWNHRESTIEIIQGFYDDLCDEVANAKVAAAAAVPMIENRKDMPMAPVSSPDAVEVEDDEGALDEGWRGGWTVGVGGVALMSACFEKRKRGMPFTDRPLPDDFQVSSIAPRKPGKRLFGPDNPGGKPKGTVAKITRDLKEGILQSAIAHGANGGGENGLQGYLQMCATKYPKHYMHLLGQNCCRTSSKAMVQAALLSVRSLWSPCRRAHTSRRNQFRTTSRCRSSMNRSPSRSSGLNRPKSRSRSRRHGSSPSPRINSSALHGPAGRKVRWSCRAPPKPRMPRGPSWDR